MLELLASPTAWSAFLTLTALELVLGIDNIVFISILADRLPPEQRNKARLIGLFLAMFMRIVLLFVLAWLVGLVAPLFSVLGEEISGRDLILIVGGLFLVYKSTSEVHHMLEGVDGASSTTFTSTFASVIAQIIMIDVVFSVDSIITAVGLVKEIPIMVAAIVVSVVLMMVFANPIGRFVSAHPTVKMLALAFLFTIGVVLIADGFDVHLPRGYIYTAMAFAVVVEMLNLRLRRKPKAPVKLRNHYVQRLQNDPQPPVTGVLLRRFDEADEVVEFEYGRFETIRINGMTLGRAAYQPGWKWSEHVGPGQGEALCSVEHLGMVLSGAAAVVFADGRESVMQAGDLFYIAGEPHDSWVVGDEPYVSLHFVGASRYARR